MLEAYRKHVDERAQEGIVPKPLNAEQVNELVELLREPPSGEESVLLDLLTERVPAGVDEAAYVKAAYLAAIAKGEASSPLIDSRRATELLGTMLGGYNIQPLIDLLDSDDVADAAADALSSTLLMFDAFHDVVEKSASNPHAERVLKAWANAEWFTNRPPLADSITLTVFMVDGETNTDDLSPAGDAWSRPDIPLHALSMLSKKMDDALGTIEALKKKGHPLVYVGDVVGTGSSRKSATNSVLWHMGDDIPHIPNTRDGGFVLGGKIAPIFFNTMEDAGALPIECDVTKISMGDVITLHPYDGVIKNESGEVISEFELASSVILDEVRAGKNSADYRPGLPSGLAKHWGLGRLMYLRRQKMPLPPSEGIRLHKKCRKSLRCSGCPTRTIL